EIEDRVPADLACVAFGRQARAPLPPEDALRPLEHVAVRNAVDARRDVLVVHYLYRSAADHPVAGLLRPAAVVAALEIAEVLLVAKADTVQRSALQVGACKTHALDVLVAGVLIDVALAAADLLAPQRIERHEGSGVLQRAVRTHQPAAGHADIF